MRMRSCVGISISLKGAASRDKHRVPEMVYIDHRYVRPGMLNGHRS